MTQLLRTKDADKAMKDHLETTRYFDEETGKLDLPTSLPPDPARTR